MFLRAPRELLITPYKADSLTCMSQDSYDFTPHTSFLQAWMQETYMKLICMESTLYATYKQGIYQYLTCLS